MNVSIRPGDTLVLRCPEGHVSVDPVGKFFPSDSKEKLYSIVAKKHNEVTIGPLKIGEYPVSVHCSDGSTQSETISIKALSSQEMPELQPMVSPFFLAFPLWFWLLVCVILGLLCSGIFFLIRAIKKRRAAKTLSSLAPQPTGQEVIESYLKKMRDEKWILKSDSQSLNEMYSRGYDSVRSFLEFKLHFKASWATSGEFLGSLKTSLLGYAMIPTLLYDVEWVLTQSDLVRFSKDHPTEQARTNYLSSIQRIYDSIIKITRSEEGEAEGAESAE